VLDNKCYVNTSLTGPVLFNSSKKGSDLFESLFSCAESMAFLITWHVLAVGTSDRDENDISFGVFIDSGILVAYFADITEFLHEP
jgi:hypothetical protein